MRVTSNAIRTALAALAAGLVAPPAEEEDEKE